jgi:hypothetical protein
LANALNGELMQLLYQPANMREVFVVEAGQPRPHWRASFDLEVNGHVPITSLAGRLLAS